MTRTTEHCSDCGEYIGYLANPGTMAQYIVIKHLCQCWIELLHSALHKEAQS